MKLIQVTGSIHASTDRVNRFNLMQGGFYAVSSRHPDHAMSCGFTRFISRGHAILRKGISGGRDHLRCWLESLQDASRCVKKAFLIQANSTGGQSTSGQRNWQYRLWDVLVFQAWLEVHRR